MNTFVIISLLQIFVPGWRHPGCDIQGTNYYPAGSTVLNDPFTVEWTWDIPTTFSNSDMLSGDVNGDGQLEVVTKQNDTLYIISSTGTTLVHQYMGISGQNYSGVAMLDDVTGDSIQEIGIGYGRNNWSFGEWKSRIYDGSGTLLKEFTKSGSHDGYMYPVTAIDSDVIMVEMAGYSVDFRGFSRWNYNTATEIWQYNVGPSYAGFSMADINGDGLLEMTYGTWTPHNGKSGNGTTDGDCYTIIINENGNSILTQIYSGGGSTDGSLVDILLKFTPSGPWRIVSLKGYDPSYYTGTSQMHIRSIDGTILHTKIGLPNTGWGFACADMDGDSVEDIVCYNGNTIYILDTLLNTKDSVITSSSVQAICDVDGDGNKEIILASSAATVICLDNHLVEKWRWTDSAGGGIYRIIVSDLDNDGRVGVIVLTQYRITLLEGSEPGGIEEKDRPNTLYNIKLSQNPVINSVTVCYTLPERSSVSLVVYDITGRVVKTLCSGMQEKGYHTVNIRNNELGKGVYFMRFEAVPPEWDFRQTNDGRVDSASRGDYKVTRKLVVLKQGI